MNKEKGLVVILSHADTIDKKEVLLECILSIKKQNYDILVSSHIEISKDINDLVDYVVYDRENPLIMYDEYLNNPSVVYVWMNLPGYEQNYPIKFNHAYAVMKLIQNGSAIAEINGYRNVHFVNYDYVLNDDTILTKHNDLLNDNDIVSYDWINYGSSHSNNISSGFFSVNNIPFFNLIKNIKSKEDYCKYGSPIFEEFLYDYVNNHSSLKTFNISISELFDNLSIEDVKSGKITTNKIATKSILDDYIINGKLYLFLTKDNNGDFYIFIKYDDCLNVKFKTCGKEYTYISKHGVNLIPVTSEYLSKGIDINIESNNSDNILIDRRFTEKTTPADCKISEKSFIHNVFNLNSGMEKKYTIEKYLDENTAKRFDLINFISNEYNFSDYLEIGVNDGSCIRRIQIKNKDGVDPSPNSEIGFGESVPEIKYQFTSDYFFENCAYKKYDVIFIDGLHHSDQVDKDIENSLKYLNDDGFIFLHDCNPPEYETQLVPRQSGIWNGDVWKSIVKIRCERSDLNVCVVDTDWGIGVIRKGSQDTYNKTNLHECLQWNYFDLNRDELLNIISVDEFYNRFKKKNSSDVSIIVSHADSEEKLNVLKRCIKSIKKTGSKIILTSHILVNEEILKLIDFFVYDVENPVIDTGEDSTTFWLSYPDYEQQYKFRINYSYSIFNLYKNAISLSNSKGFKVSHIINYDYIILDESLLKTHSDTLIDKDVVFYQQEGVDGTICPGVFSIRNNKFLELFSDIDSVQKYFSLGITQFENFLYHHFSKLNYQQKKLSDLEKKNLLDLISLNSQFSIEKEVDGFIQKTLIFISTESDKYYIFLTSNIDLEVKINIDDIIFRPKTNHVNLIEIDYQDILNGFDIEIPIINFQNKYDINTSLATCQIKNKNLIINKKNLKNGSYRTI